MIYQNTEAARRYLAANSTRADVGEGRSENRRQQPRRMTMVPIDFRDRRRDAVSDRRAA